MQMYDTEKSYVEALKNLVTVRQNNFQATSCLRAKPSNVPKQFANILAYKNGVVKFSRFINYFFNARNIICH